MSDASLTPSFDESSATEGASVDGMFQDTTPADGVPGPGDLPESSDDLIDYDALTDDQASGNDDRVDITEPTSPNLEAGDDLDTGAAGPFRDE